LACNFIAPRSSSLAFTSQRTAYFFVFMLKYKFDENLHLLHIMSLLPGLEQILLVK
jgi:hypothetical protein